MTNILVEWSSSSSASNSSSGSSDSRRNSSSSRECNILAALQLNLLLRKCRLVQLGP